MTAPPCTRTRVCAERVVGPLGEIGEHLYEELARERDLVQFIEYRTGGGVTRSELER